MVFGWASGFLFGLGSLCVQCMDLDLGLYDHSMQLYAFWQFACGTLVV